MSDLISSKKMIETKSWIDGYIDKFEKEYPLHTWAFRLKKKHSHMVLKEISDIARSIGLDEHDIALVEYIGFLHDIGRFYQMAKYSTFDDKISIDHGALGVKILRDNDILNGMDSSEKLIIETAIMFHNKAKLPFMLNKKYSLFSELVRDADKLDIFRIDRENYLNRSSVFGKYPFGNDISDNVFNQIINKTIISNCNIQNQIDFIFLRLGWFFDINFAPTFNRILEREYYKMFRSLLPETEKISTALDTVDNYLYKYIYSDQSPRSAHFSG